MQLNHLQGDVPFYIAKAIKNLQGYKLIKLSRLKCMYM